MSIACGNCGLTYAWHCATRQPHAFQGPMHDDEEAQLDAIMRAQLVSDPEVGGPRDRAIGPHPRFREMDARRELRLRGLPIPPELRDADPQRNPSGWQGGDT